MHLQSRPLCLLFLLAIAACSTTSPDTTLSFEAEISGLTDAVTIEAEFWNTSSSPLVIIGYMDTEPPIAVPVYRFKNLTGNWGEPLTFSFHCGFGQIPIEIAPGEKFLVVTSFGRNQRNRVAQVGAALDEDPQKYLWSPEIDTIDLRIKSTAAHN